MRIKLIARVMAEGVVWLPEEEDWPSTKNLSDQEWKKARDTVVASHKRFVEQAQQLSDPQLNQQVPGKDYSFAFMLQGK